MRGPRRQYLEVLGDHLASADAGGLLGLLWRWLGTALGPRSGRPLVGPALGTLVVTYRCNLACGICDLPARAVARRREGRLELDLQALCGVLDAMKAIGVIGVGVTGGEPMLRDDLLPLLAHGARRGLHVHLNTDGFRVADRAGDLCRTGLRSVNVSLDGPDPAAHDRARGRPGAYAAATSALESLRRVRGDRRWPRLTAVVALGTHNLAEVEAIARTAREAGADRLGVLPVHAFGDPLPAPEPAALAAGRAALRRLHARGLIDNSLAYLDLLPRALCGEESPLSCYAPWSSVVVDAYGEVFPCFPLMERAKAVGSLPLGPLWRGAAYARERTRLAACRACLWNCHAEMSLALPQGRRARGAG